MDRYQKAVEHYQSVSKAFHALPIEGNDAWAELQKPLADIEQDSLYLFGKMADLPGTTDVEAMSAYYATTVSRPLELWLWCCRSSRA